MQVHSNDMKQLASMTGDDESDLVLEETKANDALNAHAEASKMLEAALQQMDGIIAGMSCLSIDSY